MDAASRGDIDVAIPDFRADVQRPPDSLRRSLRDGGGALRRPGRAWPSAGAVAIGDGLPACAEADRAHQLSRSLPAVPSRSVLREWRRGWRGQTGTVDR